MELINSEYLASSYAHYFIWPDTDEWEEEQNILLNEFKTHVNDLEEGMMATQDTPGISNRIQTLNSNDRAVSPRQPPHHVRNKSL
jgi:hypothetical protein